MKLRKQWVALLDGLPVIFMFVRFTGRGRQAVTPDLLFSFLGPWHERRHLVHVDLLAAVDCA